MLTTSPMELVSMVVLREKSEDVVLRLLQLGVLHPVDIRSIEKELSRLAPFEVGQEFSGWEALSLRARELARELALDLHPAQPCQVQPYSYETVRQELDSLQGNLAPLTEKKEGLLQELKTKEAVFLQVKEYFPIPIQQASPYSILYTSVGKIDEKNIEAVTRALSEVPHLVYPFNKDASGKIILLVIGLRRDRVVITSVLDDFSWEKIEYPQELFPFSSDVKVKLKLQLDECRRRIAVVDNQLKSLAGAARQALCQMYSCIHLRKSLLEAKSHSYLTDKTVVFAGWVPREEKQRVAGAVRAIDKTSYIENKPPEDVDISPDEIPVRLAHHRWLAPFDFLVGSYGLVRYGTIDPTIFVAVSFLVMFGAMFGDVGQGGVLFLAGLVLHRSAKEGVRRAAVILSCCGGSAAVFGALYGSFFGFEFPAVWIKPMTNVMELFRLSVFFGIGFMSLGILCNIINALRDRDYRKVFFDKGGLIVAAIYWLAVGIMTKYLTERSGPSPRAVSLIAVCALVLFLQPLLDVFKRKPRENVFILFMENMVEMLEIFVGYLSNTVSFMRIAAYAITHVSLFLAIFELSKSLRGAGIIIIILGNILIILLEGLVASIQSIRLNYYEFFSKFFVTGKYVFKPLTAEIKD